jgi:hypothetical protein
VLLPNERLLLLFCLFRYRLSPETFGYTLAVKQRDNFTFYHESMIQWYRNGDRASCNFLCDCRFLQQEAEAEAEAEGGVIQTGGFEAKADGDRRKVKSCAEL